MKKLCFSFCCFLFPTKKFSYCLASHEFDSTQKTTDLTLYTGSYSSDDKTKDLGYTPFLKNPDTSPSSVYYYLSLKDIIIGQKHIRIPNKYLVPASDSKGGAIIDSGYSFGYMAKPIFDLVVTEFHKQMTMYRRDLEIEAASSFGACYNFSGEKSVKVPEIVFEFSSGAKMVLPEDNYFLNFESYTSCLVIDTNQNPSLEVTPGPSIIILGNNMNRSFYVEYDLENERLGFRKQTC